MYPKNAWYVAAWSNELVDDAPYAITILNEPLVIYRASGTSQTVVLEDRCVHRLAPLSLGRCEGANLRCMYHGLLYDPQGQVVEIPGQEKIPPQARVRSYPVAERGSWIWVWMGDPALADKELVPPAIGPEDPDYIMGQGYLDYAAEARLINDNLLDFSHLSFVHAESFKVGPEFAQTLPALETLDRGIRYSRWVPNAESQQERGSGQLTDNFTTYDFLVPGVLIMQSGSFTLGTAQACNFARPDFSQAVAGVTFTSQAVTPMTDRSARYFFCWGPHRDHGDAHLRDALMQLANRAFGEDKVMIEAQQRVLDMTADPVIMPTAHDRAVTIFNRIVARMAAA
jgi:phenylpropionate dioxygenase-like ring-hydroxylating dioxygenase large terminal subunit